MITGELKSKVDRVWDAFWSGGISNPLEVIEQITYLLFIRRLDDLNTLAEKKAHRTGKNEGLIFGPDQQSLRWSRSFSRKRCKAANAGCCSKSGNRRIKRQVSGCLSSGDISGTCCLPSTAR